ncbi:hypothetical protein ACFWC5_42675, partial [Streptomyces sp. NPDC060085]
LIRPDGHVAWATTADGPDLAALRKALTTWFGPGLPAEGASLSSDGAHQTANVLTTRMSVAPPSKQKPR